MAPVAFSLSNHHPIERHNTVAWILAMLALSSLLALAADKDAKAPVAIAVQDSAWSTTLFGTGIKTNDEYTDGNIFLTVPVWSTIGRDGTLGGNYLFVEPYTSVGTEGEVASSLGFSYRHLFSHEPTSALQKRGRASFFEEGWFAGGSLFVDMLDTQHDNKFWQLGIGAEIGTRYVELRGNYYIPLSSQKLAQRNETTQTFTSSSTTLKQTDSGSDPTATGNQIVQDVNLTTSAITTTSTTIVHTVTEIFEKGMEGWDAEMSVLLPWVDEWMDVKLIGGYFSFDNQPFGPQEFGTGHVHGWKLGAEVRPVPAVVLSGYWYEDKRFTGADWTIGVQLQVPLDRTWKDAFKMRRRHLVEHLAEPVHRQNDAIKVGNTKDENSTSNTSVARVTRVVSQTKRLVVLSDDVIFVNNGGAVGNGIQAGDDVTGDGTAEKPKATIQAGADIAATNNIASGRVWTVYTQHNPVAPYVEDVAILESTNFISSGTPLLGAGGKSFGTGVKPVLVGSFATLPCGCTPLSYVGITGYNIHATSIAAISALNVQSLKIASNVIENLFGAGIDVEMTFGTVGTAEITGNVITHTGSGAPGLAILVSDPGTDFGAEISGNRISGSGADGVLVATVNEGFATMCFMGNSFNANDGNGVSLTVDNFGDLSACFESNHFDANTGHGLFVLLDNDASADFQTFADTFIGNIGNGIHVESHADSQLFPSVIENAVIAGNTESAIDVSTTMGGFMLLSVEKSLIESAAPVAIHASVGEGFGSGGDLALAFFDDTIHAGSLVSSVGILFESPLDGVGALGVFNTTLDVTSPASTGISLQSSGTPAPFSPNIAAQIYDSTITVGVISTGSAVGIDVLANGTGTIDEPSGIALDIRNAVVDSADTGINVVTQVGGFASIGISEGSSIVGATAGVNVASSDSSGVDIRIDDGTSISSGGNGVTVTASDSSGVDLSVFDSTISGGASGIYLTENPGARLGAIIDGNTMTVGYSGYGIALFKGGVSTLADFTNNSINGGNGGLYLNNTSATTFTVNITNNQIDSTSFVNFNIGLSGNGGDFTANINSNNIATGPVLSGAGIFLEVNSGAMHVNPSPTIPDSNTIDGGPLTFKLGVFTSGAGTVDGSIIINGTTLTPPVTLP